MEQAILRVGAQPATLLQGQRSETRRHNTFIRRRARQYQSGRPEGDCCGDGAESVDVQGGHSKVGPGMGGGSQTARTGPGAKVTCRTCVTGCVFVTF